MKLDIIKPDDSGWIVERISRHGDQEVQPSLFRNYSFQQAVNTTHLLTKMHLPNSGSYLGLVLSCNLPAIYQSFYSNDYRINGLREHCCSGIVIEEQRYSIASLALSHPVTKGKQNWLDVLVECSNVTIDPYSTVNELASWQSENSKFAIKSIIDILNLPSNAIKKGSFYTFSFVES